MIAFLSQMRFLLEQTAAEKRATILSLALFAVLVFMLFLDSVIKNTIMPKNKNVKLFVIFLFMVTLIAIILLIIYYN